MIFDDILDDAALFPPGNARAEIAVPTHLVQRLTPRGRYVGPFIAPAPRAAQIAALSAAAGCVGLDVTLTFSAPDTVAETLVRAADLGHIRVNAVEVAIPAGLTVAAAVSTLTAVVPESVRSMSARSCPCDIGERTRVRRSRPSTKV